MLKIYQCVVVAAAAVAFAPFHDDCGGVGYDDRQALKSAKKTFSHLLFEVQ